MIKKYVPIEKQSKKARKAYYSQKRLDWGDVNPASREFETARKFNKAARNRSKVQLHKRQGCRMLE